MPKGSEQPGKRFSLPPRPSSGPNGQVNFGGWSGDRRVLPGDCAGRRRESPSNINAQAAARNPLHTFRFVTSLPSVAISTRRSDCSNRIVHPGN